MKRRVPLVLSLVLLVAVVWNFQTDATRSIEAKNIPSAPGRDAGLTVHIDPATKDILETPIQPSPGFPPMENDLNTSDEGLIVEDNPAGGEMVNLQGRFRHRYTAGIDANGNRTADCDLPKSTENKKSDSEEE